MPVPVDIFVNDDSLSPAPIAGVSVVIVDHTTFAFIAQAITDGLGHAAFTLPGSATPGTTYEARFFKLGVRFLNPKLIQVVDPVITTNKFDMSGTLLTLPIATDPRLCRCSGRFMDLTNAPISGAMVRIMAKGESGTQDPKVVDGNMIAATVAALTTDDDGFVTVDLLRTGQFFLTFAGEDDVVWEITVPDRSSVNLIDLIHPQPVSLSWDPIDAPGNVVSVAVGQTILVHFTVLFSDYEVLATGLTPWVQLFNSNVAIMDLGAGDGVIAIVGVAAGSAQVTVGIQPNLLPPRVPGYSITAIPLTVTVT